MRLRHWALRWMMLAAALPLAACDGLITGLFDDPDAPTNLSYQLIPSGNPDAPLGVLLTWDVPTSGRAVAFNVYARTDRGGWQLRATTTSPTFHDSGIPESQYYVASRNEGGEEIGETDPISIDLDTRPPAPQGLSSVSLNGAIQLSWSDNAVSASTFDHYLVYSAGYDSPRGVCQTAWVSEGSTVSDGFLVGNLTNGVPRCYVVSVVTHDGHESEWSGARLDTPRFDGRSALVYTRVAHPDSAGFLFVDDSTHTRGVVANAVRGDLDFFVERHEDGTLWLAPARPGAAVVRYSSNPVADLTSIDAAPESGFASSPLEARAGYGYVFRVQKADGVHFAALRVGFVTSTYVVLDWSYQSAVGNAELNVVPEAMLNGILR